MTEKGLPTVLEMILEEVTRSKAKRLVIDSFSAMAQAFKEPIEARIIIHNILGKLVRQLECTTIARALTVQEQNHHATVRMRKKILSFPQLIH